MRQLSTRRRFLATGMAATAFAGFDGIKRPYLGRAADRPAITHGLQSGDVSNDTGIVWARADRPARMLVEWSTTESFKRVQNAGFVDALPETDCTAKSCSRTFRRASRFSTASALWTSPPQPS